MTDQTPDTWPAWRPIETAPIGVDLLVKRRDGVMHVAKVSGHDRKYGTLNVDFGNASCLFFFPVNDDYEADDAPVEWMPLPPTGGA